MIGVGTFGLSRDVIGDFETAGRIVVMFIIFCWARGASDAGFPVRDAQTEVDFLPRRHGLSRMRGAA